MTYFDCFVIGAWMLGIGWLLGAIYMQNQSEKTERPSVSEKPEPSPEYQTWRVPITGSAAAD